MASDSAPPGSDRRAGRHAADPRTGIGTAISSRSPARRIRLQPGQFDSAASAVSWTGGLYAQCRSWWFADERGSTLALMARDAVRHVGGRGVGDRSGLSPDRRAARPSAPRTRSRSRAPARSGTSPGPTRPTAGQRRYRALDIARLNQVRADTIDVRSPHVTRHNYGVGQGDAVGPDRTRSPSTSFPDSQKVRAWVRHAGVSTFFGGLLGVPYGHVQAMATAWATSAGPTVNCLKPFVMPDMWCESDKATQDVNGNDYMDPITTSPGQRSRTASRGSTSRVDRRRRLLPPVRSETWRTTLVIPQTGYGSAMRSGTGYTGDVGLPMLLSSLRPAEGTPARPPSGWETRSGCWTIDSG